jgi:hypothetical protein
LTVVQEYRERNAGIEQTLQQRQVDQRLLPISHKVCYAKIWSENPSERPLSAGNAPNPPNEILKLLRLKGKGSPSERTKPCNDGVPVQNRP